MTLQGRTLPRGQCSEHRRPEMQAAFIYARNSERPVCLERGRKSEKRNLDYAGVYMSACIWNVLESFGDFGAEK